MFIRNIAKLASLVVVRALWPHDALRMCGCVDVSVLHHVRLITVNIVSYIMNEGSEGMGELENNRCHTVNKILDVRSASYVQAVCTLQLFPVLCFIHCLTILHFDYCTVYIFRNF